MEATKQTFKLLPPSILPKESTMIIQMKPGQIMIQQMLYIGDRSQTKYLGNAQNLPLNFMIQESAKPNLVNLGYVCQNREGFLWLCPPITIYNN